MSEKQEGCAGNNTQKLENYWSKTNNLHIEANSSETHHNKQHQNIK